jgi:hypothetical protein
MERDYTKLDWRRVTDLYTNQKPVNIGNGMASLKPLNIIIEEEFERMEKFEEELKKAGQLPEK